MVTDHFVGRVQAQRVLHGLDRIGVADATPCLEALAAQALQQPLEALLSVGAGLVLLVGPVLDPRQLVAFDQALESEECAKYPVARFASIVVGKCKRNDGRSLVDRTVFG